MIDLTLIDWGEQVDLAKASLLKQTLYALRPECIDKEAYARLWQDLRIIQQSTRRN